MSCMRDRAEQAALSQQLGLSLERQSGLREGIGKPGRDVALTYPILCETFFAKDSFPL